ncbi:MAG: phage holin [Bacillota bacterium]|nr:phage holin [Bacillota bacterium]
MKVSKDTIARTIVLAVSMINLVCGMLGWTPLDLSEEVIYQAVTILFAIGASIWGFWKNNSFTPAALKADEVLKAEKALAASNK